MSNDGTGPIEERLMVAVTAAILAGGLGTRLRSVVRDRPKVLAEIRGQPFLRYLLDQLAAAGVQDIVICTGYLGEQVRATFGDSLGNMRLVYSQESSPLGTAGTLRLALPLFKSGSVLVMNGDSFCDVDLCFFWDWHLQHEAHASMVLVEAADVGQFGSVEVNHAGKVIGFQEKNVTNRAGWINAGVYLIESCLIDTIPKVGAVSLERTMFPAWVGRGLYGYQSEGKFLDIGTPENYAAAEQFFCFRDKGMRIDDYQ